MLSLKEANFQDLLPQYALVTCLPKEENGFINPASGCSLTEFEQEILPGYIQAAQGLALPEGYVPETTIFLWADNQAVGLFRVRHRLTPALANGAGHIGYSIRPDCRGNGYASEGLRLTIEKAWALVPEEELYLSVLRENLPSLRVQLHNGAYIHHVSGDHFFTRIPR